jgi:glycerol-3-phosphate O-acyltransferase
MGFLPQSITSRINRSALRSVRKRGSHIDRFKLTERSRVRELLLANPDIARAVDAHASAHGLSKAKVWKLVAAYIDEIVPFFNILAYYRLGYLSSRTLLNLFYKVSA